MGFGLQDRSMCISTIAFCHKLLESSQPDSSSFFFSYLVLKFDVLFICLVTGATIDSLPVI